MSSPCDSNVAWKWVIELKSIVILAGGSLTAFLCLECCLILLTPTSAIESQGIDIAIIDFDVAFAKVVAGFELEIA